MNTAASTLRNLLGREIPDSVLEEYRRDYGLDLPTGSTFQDVLLLRAQQMAVETGSKEWEAIVKTLEQRAGDKHE